MNPWRGLFAGLGAGPAGTTALNAVTYLDMAVRGRPTSSTPEDTVEKLAAKAGIDAPMAALGVTDPRTWAAKDWLSDAVPHLAYGLVTAAVVQALDRD